MRCPRHRRPGEHLVRRTGRLTTSSGARWQAGHTVSHEWLCTCGMTGSSTRAGHLPLLPTAPVVDRAYHEDVIRRFLRVDPLDEVAVATRKAKAYESAAYLARANRVPIPNTREGLTLLVRR